MKRNHSKCKPDVLLRVLFTGRFQGKAQSGNGGAETEQEGAGGENECPQISV